MTQSEINEVLILAKMGQPFYTVGKSGTKFKYWFEDGKWSFKYHYSARHKIMRLEDLRDYLASETLISESEYELNSQSN